MSQFANCGDLYTPLSNNVLVFAKYIIKQFLGNLKKCVVFVCIIQTNTKFSVFSQRFRDKSFELERPQ